MEVIPIHIENYKEFERDHQIDIDQAEKVRKHEWSLAKRRMLKKSSLYSRPGRVLRSFWRICPLGVCRPAQKIQKTEDRK